MSVHTAASSYMPIGGASLCKVTQLINYKVMHIIILLPSFLQKAKHQYIKIHNNSSNSQKNYDDTSEQ